MTPDKDNHTFTYRLKIPYDTNPTENEMGHEANKEEARTGRNIP